MLSSTDVNLLQLLPPPTALANLDSTDCIHGSVQEKQMGPGTLRHGRQTPADKILQTALEHATAS